MSRQRDHILEQATDLFVEDGFDGFSMRKLARGVGVTAPALYKHFESKERLLQAVLVQAYETFSRYLYRGLVGATPVERMVLASRGYVDFALENPRFYELMFLDPNTLGMDSEYEDVEALGAAVGRFWEDRVRECLEAGLFRGGDPEAISTTMWAHVHGLVTLYLRGRLARKECALDDDGFRRLFHESSLRLVRGVGTEAFAEAIEAYGAASAGAADDG